MQYFLFSIGKSNEIRRNTSSFTLRE